MRRTATTANALLGLLALRPQWSTWDLAQQLRRNMRFFWPRAESRVYEEAKRLAQDGLATAARTHVGKRPRTTYTITATGRKQLERWLATPPRATSLECEALLRVMFADLGTREQLDGALDQIRADAHAILDVGRVVAAEYVQRRAPFQDDVHVRALVFDFLSNHAMMLLAWAERTEHALARWPERTDEQRAADAIEHIKRMLAVYPAATRSDPSPTSRQDARPAPEGERQPTSIGRRL